MGPLTHPQILLVVEEEVPFVDYLGLDDCPKIVEVEYYFVYPYILLALCSQGVD
jgi:hypothetical protein